MFAAMNETQILTHAEYKRRTAANRSGLHPEHWPDDVNVISQSGLEMLGVDLDGNLYLDGKRLYPERRLGRFERWMAAIASVAGILGVGATVVSAIADWHQAFPNG